MKCRLQLKIHCSNPGHIDEDAIAVKNNAAAVFDGVTLEHQIPYPNPSPAAKAARLGAETAVRLVTQYADKPRSIEKSLIVANEAIKALNESLGITAETVDFLKIQYASAVGAVAALVNSTLYYAQINDCGVMVCKPDGEIIDKLIADKSDIDPYLKKMRNELGFQAGSREEHIFVRSKLANNPRAEFEERLLNDGVLTGEEVATRFINSRQLELKDPTKVIVYSDGFISLVEDLRFRRKILLLNDGNKAKQYADQTRKETNQSREASLVILEIHK